MNISLKTMKKIKMLKEEIHELFIENSIMMDMIESGFYNENSIKTVINDNIQYLKTISEDIDVLINILKMKTVERKMVEFARHSGHLDHVKLKSIMKRYNVKHINSWTKSGEKTGWFLMKDLGFMKNLNLSSDFLYEIQVNGGVNNYR